MLDKLDKDIYTFTSEVDLIVNEPLCAINHGIEYEKNPIAIDFFCQTIKNSEGHSVTLRIPICSECIAALYSPYQILFICIRCSSAQWLFREGAKNTYPEDSHVIFFKKCPHCNE